MISNDFLCNVLLPWWPNSTISIILSLFSVIGFPGLSASLTSKSPKRNRRNRQRNTEKCGVFIFNACLNNTESNNYKTICKVILERNILPSKMSYTRWVGMQKWENFKVTILIGQNNVFWVFYSSYSSCQLVNGLRIACKVPSISFSNIFQKSPMEFLFPKM